MDIKEVLAKRMQDLGYSNYRIAQLISHLRAEGDEVPPVTRYSSGVNRALSEPRKSKFETLEEIVNVLDGEFYIRWHNPEDIKLD